MNAIDEQDRKLAALYHQSATEQPAAELDEHILRLAQTELKPRSKRHRFSVPLSAAAGLLLALGLTRLVIQEQPQEAQMPLEIPQASSPEPMMQDEAEARPLIQQKSRAAPSPRLELRESFAPPASVQAPAGIMEADRAQAKKQAMPDNAEQLIAEIRDLLAQNQRQAARQRLEQLQLRYPQHPLPPDLQSLLDEIGQ